MPWMPLDIAEKEVDAFTRAFQEKAIFYLDESVDGDVADGLRTLGYKAKSFRAFGMGGRADRTKTTLPCAGERACS